MSTKAPKTIHPLIVAGIKGLFAGLRSVFWVIRVIPAADRIVFLSRQSNTPSADMLAIGGEIAARKPNARIVMLCRNMASNRDFGYGFHLLRQMWHVAHARTIVLDSYSFLTSNGIVRPDARVVQVWHAIGSFKKFGWSADAALSPRRRQLAKALHMHAGNTTVVASSAIAAVNFAEAFGVSPSQVAVSPLPRVDRILDSDVQAETRASVRAYFQLSDTDRLLLIAPTIHSTVSEATIQKLMRLGQENNWRVIASRHPVTHPSATPFSSLQQLAAADAFITDKSSMIYEAGLLGIPAFLWAPRDAQKALFAESYPTEDELRPLIVESFDGLFGALESGTRRNAAARFASEYVDIDPTRSATERIVDIVLSS